MELFEFEQQVQFSVVIRSVYLCPRVGLEVNLSLHKNGKSLSGGIPASQGTLSSVLLNLLNKLRKRAKM